MKVTGSYPTLLRGVSQQAPQDRRPGQHTEQVNMLPDPVNGLTRRWGSLFLAEQFLPLSPVAADFQNYRKYEYASQGIEYVLLYRTAATPAGSTLPPLIVYNKTAATFVPYAGWQDAAHAGGSAAHFAKIAANGLSSVTAVGRYLVLACNNHSGTVTSVDNLATNQNRGAVWFKGGAYARKFTLRLKKTGVGISNTFEYTTPTAAYPGTLDTRSVSPFMADMTGATAGTAPDGTPYVDPVPNGPEGYIVPGSTYTLLNSPSTAVITQVFAERLGPGSNYLYEGADYTLSGGTLTWTYGVGLDSTFNVQISYTVPAGGTIPTLVYPTQEDTEPLAVSLVDGYGRAELTWAAWNPVSLTVTNLQLTLTNVHPAMPANSSQYSWAGGNTPIFLVSGYAGYQGLTARYTHTKTVPNPQYNKQINDLTAAYNTAVNQWIATAGAAVQPAAIAEQFRQQAAAVGYTVQREGSTLIFDSITMLTADDAGDGSLVAVAFDTATNTDELTPYHYYGKVMAIRPRGGNETYYMQARLNSETVGTTGQAGAVQWFEGAAVTYTPQDTFLLATVYAGSLGVYTANAGHGAPANGLIPPRISSSLVGDADTSPPAPPLTSQIHYLATMHDRLLIGTGTKLAVSKVTDYFNFFRSTVLSVPASDAFDVAPPGTDDDTFRNGVMYDRNLVIFGDKRQYVISGRTPLAPTAANVQVMASHSDAGIVPAVAAGNLILYAKRGEIGGSLWQVLPGDNPDTSQSFTASAQLTDYLPPTVLDITAVAQPQAALLRVAEQPRTLYTYFYRDSQEGRVQEAWFKLTYHLEIGSLLGAVNHKEGAILFSVRNAAGNTWVVADYQSLNGTTPLLPHLDSARPWTSVAGSAIGAVDAHAAYARPVSYQLRGGHIGDASLTSLVTQYGSSGLWQGFVSPASVSPTNPFIRDRNDKAITTGRLTVTKHLLAVEDTQRFTVVVNNNIVDHTGITEGDAIGTVVLRDKQVTVPIGKESRSYTWSVTSASWLPLTVAGIEYVGQYFNRAQRI
jgi:hypothetical protein